MIGCLSYCRRVPGRVLAPVNFRLVPSGLVQVQDQVHVSGWYSGGSDHWVKSRCARKQGGGK